MPFAVETHDYGRAQTVATRSVSTCSVGPTNPPAPSPCPVYAKCNCAYSQHAHQVWASVLRAKGFHGGFGQSWLSCSHKTFGAPEHVPWFPSNVAIATAIFEAVVIQVRSLEAQLKATSRQYAKLRPARDPNVIFRDIKQAPANGVSYLLRPMVSHVLEGRDDECAVVVELSQPRVAALKGPFAVAEPPCKLSMRKLIVSGCHQLMMLLLGT